jgi:hypothetical protein
VPRVVFGGDGVLEESEDDDSAGEVAMAMRARLSEVGREVTWVVVSKGVSVMDVINKMQADGRRQADWSLDPTADK